MLALPFYAEALGASATVLGFILAAYAAAQFLCAPLWGKLSDRIGRRRVLLVSIAGMGVSLFWLGLADTIPAIFAARVVGGAFAANIGVASAYIADVTDASERTRWMGVLGACFGVGFVLGPAIAALLEPFGDSLLGNRAAALPLLVAAGLAGLNWLWAVFSLQEPPHHKAPEPEDASGRFSMLRDPTVRRLCAAWLIFSLAVTQLEATFAFFMITRFDADMLRVGFIFVGMAVLMGGIQGGGMKFLAVRFGERTLVVAGAVVCGISFVGIPLAGALPALIAVLALGAIGRAIVQPSLMGLVATASSETTRGLTMGTFQSAGSLARVFGPAMAGWLFDTSFALPFWFAAVLFVVVAWLSRMLPQRAAEQGAPA
jgi:MFS family permease